ncbi:MAG TPA: prolyl oligopeptidase family serine peptidase [Enhygromyxa sp.]|nr:prolyl oligopeptidase family serine peptidase [Enhygromyxa sp.]
MPSLARTTLLLLAPLWLALACVPPNAATPYPTAEPAEGEPSEAPVGLAPTAVQFFDRAVDLAPFLDGFPYNHFTPTLEHGRLYYVETGERYLLRSLPLPQPGQPIQPLDLSKGELVTEVDWSTRSLWSIETHAPSNTLWLHADARNDEQMNLWRLDLSKPAAERVPEQITSADYVYGFGFSEDDTKIAYLARTGQQAPYRTCLRLLDATSPESEGGDREVVCDSAALQFTWGTPRFSPDGKQVYFAAQIDGDRKRVQIVEVDLSKPRPVARPITDTAATRSDLSLLDGWVDGELLLFTADDAGYGDVYSWSRRTRKTNRLTQHKEALLGAEALQIDDSPAVLLAHGTPAGSTMKLLDAKTGAVLGHASVAGKISIEDAHGRRAIWSQEAPDKVFEADLVRFTGAGSAVELQNDALIRLPSELEDALVQCRAEAVKIPTFDGISLHAFVLRPKQPLAEPIAMVRSFYGGDNEWNEYDHILCAAGITVVSPSVRGSSGFGAAFEALNDRDLGGDEIVDLFRVAGWIERELDIPPARIGVYGRSHGGYATMRAMTFPPQTNDRNESYRFAFGLAEAGFCDIVAFHDATNIPDWVVLEAGDPAVPNELDKLRDRSPLNHVERLDAPLFLLHGGNDWRVPVEGSRAFAARAKQLGKPVTYLEVEGQGHRIEGQERIVAAWRARLEFLESVLASGEGDGATKNDN